MSGDARKLLLGAEACLWGEHTNGAVMTPPACHGSRSADKNASLNCKQLTVAYLGQVMNVRAWPRAAALAEALWSGDGGNVTEALPRLLRHRCRMVQRGVPVTPLQPGFC